MTSKEIPSRREALKRMAKVSFGMGLGLQLIGAFVPQAEAAAPGRISPRFDTIGKVSLPAGLPNGVSQDNTLRGCGVYTKGGGYAQNGYADYGRYQDYVNDGNCG
ncbi:MAG: hypothetical protein RDU13_04485 [Elusimicrobiales bacterium]|nr:hypothetical protein [Elusimicrobiales bacterium]